MTKRETLVAARSEVAAGNDRKVVFETYRAQGADPKSLASIIASVARDEDKKRYGTWNLALVALLALGALTKVLGIWAALGEASPLGALLASAIALCFSFAFAQQVYTFSGQVYGWISVLATLALLNALARLVTDPQNQLEADISMVFLGAILALSVGLQRKLFPGLSLLVPRKDATGEYALG